MRKEIILNLEKIEEEYRKAKIERLKKNYPVRFKRTKPREKFKRDVLIEFLVRITPPAKDILSGRAFSELFKKEK
ncbi:MAG: hypothetical protein DSY42_02870 [Aquifex sp.]|nr:MAG: hypothetical protein DSY42_02870 [Aquifex sp.]